MAEKEEEIPEPTNAKSGEIRVIGKDTVHKICSGQVVLSLAIAVKELVENSLDAGATLVEVRLREQGLESVEVTDNGCGVEEKNLEAMTAKYHTSKLREFHDLLGVETFGFRGEALSSLCALSDMLITTRHTTANVGVKIELDHHGNIKKRTPCARNYGTTVMLTNLFATLPVRRRDFVKNIKKEFTKMGQILQAYCLVSKGVRIICTNQTAKGTKSVIIQTNGANDILANISAVFGSRQANDIMPIVSPFDTETITADNLNEVLKNDTGETTVITDEDIERLNASQFQLEGFISSCSHGAGRSSKDRQFYFINSRPCDPKNISKVVNEVYHRYNMQQHPFIYLNVITARNEVDINLTPDKRQLLLNNEKILLLAIKKALINTFGNVPSTYNLQNSSILTIFKAEPSDKKATKENSNELENIDETNLPIASTQSFANILSQWKHTGDTRGGPAPTKPPKRKCTEEIAARTMKMQKIHEFLSLAKPDVQQEKNASYKSEDSDSEIDDNVEKSESIEQNHNDSKLDLSSLNKESAEFDVLTSKTPAKSNTSIVERIVCKNSTPAKITKHFIELRAQHLKDNATANSNLSLSQTSSDNGTINANLSLTQQTSDSEIDDTPSCSSSQTNAASSQDSSNKNLIKLDGSDEETSNVHFSRACAEIRTSIQEIEAAVKAEEKFNQDSWKIKLDRLRFKSEINPSQNKNAEDELQREIRKDSFAHMKIIGQFNLGFVIVQLDDDLFIIDQHASDEKYNFEMLQRTTVLQYQQLAVPQPLELTAVNELVLMDHLDVFEKNGFKFEIDENAPATKKVKLLGKPMSKNWEFGKDDIDELIFMLQDAPEGTICRPSRIRAMFASRACRKSVMIGNALNKSAMKKIVRHMGEIEQPWNCPHGRPTMRHLINTAMLLDTDET